MLATSLLVSMFLAQAPASANPQESRAEAAATRAAEAAERAARAAQAAAEAAAKAADAAGRATQPGAAAAPAPQAPAAPSAWKGTAGLALIWLAGNASTITLNASGAAERAWDNWLLGLKANAVYGLTRLPTATESDVVALGAGLQVRGERKVVGRVGFYLMGGVDTDHVKSIEYRATGEGGASINWLETKEGALQKTLLRTDLALRYGHECRYQYFPAPEDVPDVDLLGPKAGLLFRYAINEGTLFTEDLEVIPGLLGTVRLLVNSTTKLSARLTDSVSLGVAFQVAHDSVPAQGKVPTDTALTVGLEAKL